MMFHVVLHNTLWKQSDTPTV